MDVDGDRTEAATRTEARLRELLGEVYLPEGVEIWLNHQNRHLDMKTPRELISTGSLSDISAVLAEAERLVGGAW